MDSNDAGTRAWHIMEKSSSASNVKRLKVSSSIGELPTLTSQKHQPALTSEQHPSKVTSLQQTHKTDKGKNKDKFAGLPPKANLKS